MIIIITSLRTFYWYLYTYNDNLGTNIIPTFLRECLSEVPRVVAQWQLLYIVYHKIVAVYEKLL